MELILIETIHLKRENIVKMQYIDCNEVTFQLSSMSAFKNYILLAGQDFRCFLKTFGYLSVFIKFYCL